MKRNIRFKKKKNFRRMVRTRKKSLKKKKRKKRKANCFKNTLKRNLSPVTIAICLDLATAALAHKWTGKMDCLIGRAVNPKIGGKSWYDAKPKSHAVGHVANMQLACPSTICHKDDDWLPRVQVCLRPRLPSPHLRSTGPFYSFLF
jgi:hypothetical protein